MLIVYKGKEFPQEKDLAMSVIGGRWKIAIVWALLHQPTLRLSELGRLFPDINQRMLIRQLRELEEDEIIHRTVYPVVPPKVDYQLTDVGLQLEPVVTAICNWGETFHHYISSTD